MIFCFFQILFYVIKDDIFFVDFESRIFNYCEEFRVLE